MQIERHRIPRDEIADQTEEQGLYTASLPYVGIIQTGSKGCLSGIASPRGRVATDLSAPLVTEHP